MKQAFRILQLSDLHIGPDAQPVKGHDTRKKFLQVLERLSGEDWDLVVLSGDLAADQGEIEAYRWLRDTLERYLSYPYIVMAGNHDRVANMREVFDIPEQWVKGDQLYFCYELKGTPLYCLDTSDYQLPAAQLDWLVGEAAAREERGLLFIHHPPVLCGCRFMDSRYPLGNIDQAWPVLREIPQIEDIFCGHYHTAKTLSIDGKMIHLAPAIMMQIDPRSVKFAIQHTRPGWRIIEWNGEELYTTARHLV